MQSNYTLQVYHGCTIIISVIFFNCVVAHFYKIQASIDLNVFL